MTAFIAGLVAGVVASLATGLVFVLAVAWRLWRASDGGADQFDAESYVAINDACAARKREP